MTTKIGQNLSLIKWPFFVLSVLSLLSGCGPKFLLENYHNDFRNIDVCQMQNNIVKDNNLIKIVKNNMSTLSFDLWKKTEFDCPYGLTVSMATVNTCPEFREDSHAKLCLKKNRQTEVLNIISLLTTCDTKYEISSYNGAVCNTRHIISKLHFSLTKEQILKIASADGLSFSIETTRQQPVLGTLNDRNIAYIKHFADECLFCD